MSVIKAQNENRHDNASGDALLADQYSRGEKDTSRDALLVRSKQRESNAASGDASLVPLQKQTVHTLETISIYLTGVPSWYYRLEKYAF